MPAEELLVAGDHLVECAECKDRLGDSIDWRAPLFGDPARLSDTQDNSSVHLSFEQLAGYTDGTLNDVDRKLVERHIIECSVCSEELHDLQQLASELPKQSPVRPQGPLARLFAALSQWIVPKPSQRAEATVQVPPVGMEPIHETGGLSVYTTDARNRVVAGGSSWLLSAESTIDLVVRARTGDREAIESVMQRCVPDLTRWAHGRLPAAAREDLDTDDLVQETVLHVLRRLEHFEPRHVGALQAYLRQSVINRIRDEVRRVGRRPPAAVLPRDSVPEYASPLELAVQGEAYHRYHDALLRLRAEDRELVVARIEAQWTMAEIAGRFGMKTSDAARVAVTRALKKLSDEFGGV